MNNINLRLTLSFIILCLFSIVSIAQTKIWVGTDDSDWNNSSNWSGGVPNETHTVEISSGPNDPEIESGVIVGINDLVIEAGATLTINDGAQLTINRVSSSTYTANIWVQSGASLENFGLIDITGNTEGALQTTTGILNHGTIVNRQSGNLGKSGIINIKDLFDNSTNSSKGISNQDGGIFTNESGSEIYIDNIEALGLTNETEAQFTNAGTIYIEEISGSEIITSAGIRIASNTTFINNNIVDVRNSVSGISLRSGGKFINNSTIYLDGFFYLDEFGRGGRAINATSSDIAEEPSIFINNENAAILINQRFEQTAPVGIILFDDTRFENRGGYIKIDHIEGTNSAGIDLNENSSFVNGNGGLLEFSPLGSIFENLSVRVFDQAAFSNENCSGIILHPNAKTFWIEGNSEGLIGNKGWIISYISANTIITTNFGTILNFGNGNFTVRNTNETIAGKSEPAITQEVFCYGTEEIQFSPYPAPVLPCKMLQFRRKDNNELNTSGTFAGLLPGQSYDIEILHGDDVVDTYTHTVSSTYDQEAPALACTPSTYTFDITQTPNPTLNLDDFAEVSSNDGCDIASFAIQGYGDSRSFSCDDAGTNTLVVEVIDLAGNTSTCSVTVEITDAYPSSLEVVPLNIGLDANGQATLSNSDLQINILDVTSCFSVNEIFANYSVPTNWQNLGCEDIGVHNILLDKDDSNFPDLTLELTVSDPVAIAASVAPVTIALGANGIGSLSKSDLIFTVSDNCYTDQEIIANYSLPTGFTSFDCGDIGTFAVTLTSSNTGFPTVIFQVTVESGALSFPPITTDFCAESSFDLTALEDDFTTASGTFTYSQTIERLYLPNAGNNSVNVVDLATNTLLTTISVGTDPWGVGVHPNSKKVYVTNRSSNDVSVIDVATNTVEASIDVGVGPVGTAFNSDGSRLYVTNANSGNLSVINTATNTVVNTIAAGTAPWGITLSPDNSSIYVANQSSDNISVINANTGATITTVDVQNIPADIAISADGSKLFVANESGFDGNNTKGAISIIDLSTNTVVQTLFTNTGLRAKELTVDPIGNLYTQLDGGNGVVSRLNPGGNTFTYYTVEDGVNNGLTGIDINENGSRLYLTDAINNKVIIFNTLTNTEVTSISIGGVGTNTGTFYVKTTIDITSPESYTPNAGDVVDVTFDGGGDCAATSRIIFGEASDNQCNAAPIAVCQNIIVAVGDNCQVSITATDVNNGSYDPDGDDISFSLDQSGPFALGTHTVTLTVDDGVSRSTCTARIKVEDYTAPVASCQNISVELDPSGQATITPAQVDGGSTDNCGSPILSFGNGDLSLDCNDVGSTSSIILEVRDAADNFDQCTAYVEVTDPNNQCNLAPIAVCQDITVYTGDNCQAAITAIQLDGGSSDPDGDELIFSVEEEGPFTVGAHVLTLTVGDGSLSSTCTATVTVEDNTAPTAICQDVTIQLDDTGLTTITAAAIDNGSTDLCGITNLSLDKANFDCANTGDNTVTLTATDLNGNSSSCQATVTVVDDTKPTLTCPEDMAVNTDQGECGAYITLPKAAPADNCGIKNLKSRYRSLDGQGNPIGAWSGWADDHSGFFELGAYEVQWRAQDASENEDFCSFQLDIIDEEAPEVICTDVTINFNGEETIAITSSSIFDEATSFDACGAVSLVSQSLTEVSCDQVGETLTVQVIGVDPNGNTNTCTAQVTVTGIPCGFEATDVDCPYGAEAAYDPVAESFTLTANDCEGYPDGEFSAVMTELCGDGEIIAKVVSLIGDGRAGVIMMESDEPGTRFVSKIKDLTPRPRTEYRTTTGGSISNKRKTRLGVEWVRIVRQGNKFKTYTSTNGSYWRLSHIINFSNFADCIQVGMLVYSKNANEPVTAVFENVEVTGDTPSALEQGTPRVVSELQGIDAQQIQTDLDAGLGLNVAPNPFAIDTQIEFTLPKDSDVTLEIYNLHGQRVQSLENARLDAGMHHYEWDGNSSQGESLPTGIYMLRLRADKKWITTKVSLVNR